MINLKTLVEQFRAYNLDTDEELDLDMLADIDLEELLGGEYSDDVNATIPEVDYDDLSDLTLTDLADYYENSKSEDKDDLFDDEIGGDTEEFDSLNAEDERADTLDDTMASDEETAEADEITQDTDDALPSEDFNPDQDGNPEDEDYQGEIRTVRGANLVFKRKTEDGNYEELWIYNVGNDMKRETQIRRAILAGTDIDPASQQSKDGDQYCETTSTGNVQFLHIVGLPQ